MHNNKRRISAIYYVIMGYNILQMCWCAGSFEIRLIGLSQTSSGASIEFRPELRFCLKHFERRISHNGECTFGEVTLDAERLKNGTKIEFQFAWPESFTLITEAWRSNGNTKELIFHDGFQRESVPSGSHWHDENLLGADGFNMQIAYRILCARNYYGRKCDTFCQPISDAVGHFRCTANGTVTCASGWEGMNCDIASARCDNCVNGVCDKPGSCRCKTGWTGPDCDQCVRYPGCKHGSCKLPDQCICDEGWGGHFCSEDLIYCTRHRPCKNGATCRNTGHGQYTCECADGFIGTNCEIRVQNCSSRPCRNGATCMDLSGNDYTCRCPVGYSGRHCQVLAHSCIDDPCQNGATCVPDVHDGLVGFRCTCAPGWTDIICDTELRPCDGIECFNGGKCVESSAAGSYECLCPSGYTGKNCETNANECALFNPCKNGGRCIDEVNNYKCECQEGFTGTLCEHHAYDCTGQPCKNGARCIDLPGNRYQCQCTSGYRGALCDIVEHGCNREPCRNGGKCVESLQGFRCICPPCYFGESCTLRETHCKVVANRSELSHTVARFDSNQEVQGSDNPTVRNIILFALPTCCVLAIVLSVATAIFGRKRCTRRSSSDPLVQNALNWRALSKCCEQKPCLVVRAQNTYCDHHHTCDGAKTQKKKISQQSRQTDTECKVRYASSSKLPSHSPIPYSGELIRTNVNHSNVKTSEQSSSTPLDADSYYEEIDNDLRPCDVDSDSGIVNLRVTTVDEQRIRRRSQDGCEFIDLQTIL